VCAGAAATELGVAADFAGALTDTSVTVAARLSRFRG